MTQENKDLLLRDLCARLPYGVKIQVPYEDGSGYFDEIVWEVNNDGPFHVNGWGIEYEYVKPYLFPLSSMTEKQLYELKEATDFKYNDNTLELVEWTETHRTLEFWLEEVPQYKVVEVFDWLDKNHFDYRCLIERGLAIDATGLNIY